MRVVEIFDSIDGEGKRAGIPASFIRLAGCNLRCTYCDTAYALYGEKEPCRYTEMTPEEIADKITLPRVTLTGGEPLIHENAKTLIDLLLARGLEINIETNGAADISEFVTDNENLFFTIDYKLPSSGECEKMLWSNFLKLKSRDVVKFVIGTDNDFEKMREITARLKSELPQMPHIFAGAVFGEYDPARLVDKIIADDMLWDARVQLQMHKFIWDPDKRGV